MIDDDEATRVRDHAIEVSSAIEQHTLSKHPRYRRLIKVMAAEVSKAEPENHNELLDQGLSVIEEIMNAVNKDGWAFGQYEEVSSDKITFWKHLDRPIIRGKKFQEPYIMRHDTEMAAKSYLNLPYRVPAVDRMLVDMLIASEMFSFADEVQPILNKKLPLLLRWLLNNTVGLIFGCTIAAICFWIGDGSDVLNWIGGIILGLTLLGTGWSLIAFPFYYPKVKAHHRKIEEAIDAMLGAYAAMGGSPASTRHIDEMLAKAADKGVVWPSPLMVLMDDIRARSITI